MESIWAEGLGGRKAGGDRWSRFLGFAPQAFSCDKIVSPSWRKERLAVPEKILELVERFDLDLEKYKQSYKEEEIKIEFINPFLEALGWDVSNKNNKSPNEREVRFEDTIESEGKTRRPDYSFWLDRERKFFLDAKAPSVNVEGGINPAFQVKSYAWSANLPVAIVTDFEEFAIYDCSTEPFKFDKPQKSRLKIIKYYEYEKKWDEIASLFSKDAVLKGSLKSIPQPKGKKVDKALLEDISEWREKLAININKMNPNLNQKSLNHAVQMIIDRILFLRICEDRSIEDYGRLKKLLEIDNVYPKLFELFEEADKRYNSGLFHFHAEEDRNNFDTITSSLKIEDKVLKDIIQGLYYPDSPYVFSEIPAEILGQVYEQFLGKVIRLDENHKVNIEFKPEVRKSGGVYYTPSYIVDYIVKNTVGKLLDGKIPKEASYLRILDPACGSGSFLIGAYQYLLDWHLEWYKNNLVPLKNAGYKDTSKEVQERVPAPIEKLGKNARAKSKRIWERASVATLPIEQRAGEWHLRTAERKRILLNNIYGVDIDTQAIEVTKLSLLLKVLEGENKATIADLTMYSDERALPDLGNNIKCGNSLIGWDILNDVHSMTQEEKDRINPFDWETEFSEIIKAGGFHAIIGNPPYLFSAGEEYLEYFTKKYKLAQYQTDFYVYFIERSLSLSISGGIFSFIVPDSWLNSEYFSKVRTCLLEMNNINSIAIFEYPVFDKVAIENSIFAVNVSKQPGLISIHCFLAPKICETINELDPRQCLIDGLINPRKNSYFDKIINKIESNSMQLNQGLKINRGIHAYRTDGYGQSKFGPGPQTKKDKEFSSYHADRPIDGTYLLEIKGKHVDRFSFRSSHTYISYGSWLAEPRTPEFFFKPKLAIRKIIGIKLHGMLFEEAIALDQSLYIIISECDDVDELKHVLGILLSRICSWYLVNKYSIHDKLYPWFTKKQLALFPMKKKDSRMVSLVDSMLLLHKQLQEAHTPHEQTALQRQIAATDRQVDALVYELYGLTDEEIKIVEGI